MPYSRFFLLLSLLALSTLGCKKDASRQYCQDLTEAMAANNTQAARAALTQFIDLLPSKTYTSENLNRLATFISGQCGIAAEVLCFDCIKTLPSQSEIRLTSMSSGVALQRIIDLSYTPDGQMKFVNMHE